MSGTNPFRRNPAQQTSFPSLGPVHSPVESHDRPDPRIPSIDTDLPRPIKSRTGKTVRIISPHSATSDGEHGMPHRFFSPPPILPPSSPSDLLSPQSMEDDSLEDPFNAEPDGARGNTDDESTQQNTLTNSGFRSTDGGASVTRANPFKKTLASLGIDSRPGPPSSSSQDRTAEAEVKNTRPHYDVDDFKRLLLTGETSVSGANAGTSNPVSFSPVHVGDSSSNTDAFSILEPVSGPLQESPRTSHEILLSDDEQQSIAEHSLIASEKVKPSTPKHRHGTFVQSNAPQTVSFDDPTLSYSDSALSAMAPVDRSMPGTTDVEKPLPPLPVPFDIQSSTLRPLESTNHDLQGSLFESERAQSTNLTLKRSPPAPPVLRRHNQLRAKPFTSSTERSTPITEEGPIGLTELSQPPPSVNARAPAPPPPRRAGLVRGNSSSSVSMGTSFTPVSGQANTPDVDAPSTRSRPPSTRSPSVSSAKRSNQTQSIPGSPVVAPPPPPRRRGSSQSSYTPSRLSGHYTERLRSDSSASSSISHLAMAPLGPSGAEIKDVMADLSALQREVDELRGKFKD